MKVGNEVHCMETFSALLVLREGNPPTTGGFFSQKTSNAGFDVRLNMFHIRLNICLNKQSSYW